ncbi:LuxR C-terminal-related transcriptional regulator [Streptomyces griseus]|uniref:LuxR family transcriptional regulator AbsR2 n=1 Tax=Streptomyces griseus TaxID=1911 RepID=UPI0005651C7F|nr:LuxR C-terminal-related transcriptional regulator [Streptomyces griseus]
MTTFERDAKTLELPWPFTGREEEVELVRRCLAGGRGGIAVTGPTGCGKTRLATQAVRGADCARIAGTPESRHIPFAAFAHLLPDDVSLPRAIRLLCGVRLLLVDDAHLLDDASAALVHQLAVRGRTRLLVVATDGATAPGAVSRLWRGELLPRLVLAPLPREATADLLTAGAGGPVEPLTVNRVHHLCGGDLRLLRHLLDALRERGGFTGVPDTGERAWRGPLPLTTAVREHAAAVLDRTDPVEREALDRLAFAEPLPLDADTYDLGLLERLESYDLVHADDAGAVRLTHPLHGPALRAAAGRLRARRLTRTPDDRALALKSEQAALEQRIDAADVRALPTPVGEWLAQEGGPVPAAYAAVRARFARLRGELREAMAWAREAPRDEACRVELALAAAQSGEVTTVHGVPTGTVAGWLAAARGDIEGALERIGEADAYDAVRLGAVAQDVVDRLPAGSVFARHAQALARSDGPALDRAAEALEERGFLLFAAEAHAQAVPAHRDPAAARTSRTRAVALAHRCQGARTPALAALVLGELTARQRQIVTLAAAGLTNRQIAERLTLSVRTVGNHLYGAYTRLGANDRGALPCLFEQPDDQPAAV